MYDYERYGSPFRCGNRWYYSYNEGLRPQSVFYTLDEDAIDTNSKGTVFFDPNTLSEDGTVAVLPS
jgi:prolyl oligopeptidase